MGTSSRATPRCSTPSWRSQVPDDFRFCFKFPRTITHDKLLTGASAEVNEVFGRIAPLGETIGTLFLQLPPRFGVAQLPLLSSFLIGEGKRPFFFMPTPASCRPGRGPRGSSGCSRRGCYPVLVRFMLLVFVAACTRTVAPPPTKLAPPPAPPVAAQPADQDAPSWIGVRFDRKTTRVIQVVPDGPADKAGVKIGDQVISIDGRAMFIDIEAVQTIRGHAPAATPFVMRRDGKDLLLTIHIARMPDVDELSKQTLVGKPAPAFAAQPIAGSYSPVLADLKGHVIVVDFWATWCGPCAVTIPFLNEWQTKYGPRGLRIVGLTAEDEPTVKEFLAANPLSYAVARDVDDRIGQAYLRFAVPMLVVIDKGGVVRHVQVGTDGFESVEAELTKLL